MDIGNQRKTLITTVYYLTPVFILLDYVFGFNVRVAGLENLGAYKYYYYVFCIICAVMIYQFEKYSLFVGFFESVVNLIILFIAFFMPYINYIDVLSGESTSGVQMYSLGMMINLMISGFIMILSFNSTTSEIREKFGV